MDGLDSVVEDGAEEEAAGVLDEVEEEGVFEADADVDEELGVEVEVEGKGEEEEG